MASVVDICNGALNQLGASTILSLTEDSKNARLCNARYTQVRDSLFRSHPWNCLVKRVELAKLNTKINEIICFIKNLLLFYSLNYLFFKILSEGSCDIISSTVFVGFLD